MATEPDRTPDSSAERRASAVHPALDDAPGRGPTHDTLTGDNYTPPKDTPRRVAWVAAVGHSMVRVIRTFSPRGGPRLINVLRVLGLARRAVPQPVIGPRAYVQWWQRIIALIILIAVVVALGLALAATIGILIVIAGFLLEQAIA